MATTLKLGWTDPLTGLFGDHPTLGPVFDLNDGITFTLATPDGLALQPPTRTVVAAGNIRTRGERASRAIYRHNRQAVARVIVGPMASYADLIANVRALVALLNAPPAVPFSIQYQPNGASLPVYLDVVACAHTIPEDEGQWLRLQFEPVEIVFVCRPGLRGDRVLLQNLASNPGYEAPSGPGIFAFGDGFTTTNAYSLQAGAAPSVSANVMTMPSGTRLAFGSPSWGALQTWQVRWQWVTGSVPTFALHYTDANNVLDVWCNGVSMNLQHIVGGTSHTLATASIALANGAWYWVLITQFPSVAGNPPFITATLYNDASGSVGSQVATLSGPAFDSVTALVGRPQISASGASLMLGGTFGGVHNLNLFGPGGWTFNGNFGTRFCSAGWDGALPERGQSGTAMLETQTYGGGPVTSFGAARIDCPPAGTVSADWFSGDTTSAATIQQTAIPVSAPGDVLGISAFVRSSGIGANCGQTLVCNEYDSSGAFLRQNAVSGASVSGPQAAWTKLSGTYTTGASCAYVILLCGIADANAGQSANGTVWFDNVQVWDQTKTGMASMPWCQLRMPQSPCEIVLSGLLGDLPAPAALALGTYLASFGPGSALSFAVGRRNVVAPSARLVGPPVGFYGSALAPQSSCVLDASSYGGYYIQATVTSSGWNPRFVSVSAADDGGVFHVFSRFLTKQATGNLANVTTGVAIQQRSQPWYGDTVAFSDFLGSYSGPTSAPIKQSNTWTVADSGQAPIPFAPAGALTDLTQMCYTPRGAWGDGTPGGSTCQAGWQLLLPVDGSLLVGTINNPSNGLLHPANAWLWAYLDGLLTNRAGASDGPSWLYSLESVPVPNPARGAGSFGTQTTGTINVNNGADPYLVLDPTLAVSGQSAGVNQLAAYIADQNGAVLPLYGELAYSPLYLYPR